MLSKAGVFISAKIPCCNIQRFCLVTVQLHFGDVLLVLFNGRNELHDFIDAVGEHIRYFSYCLEIANVVNNCSFVVHVDKKSFSILWLSIIAFVLYQQQYAVFLLRKI
jgi:hypothetical protein